MTVRLAACRLQRIKDIAGPSGQDDAALDALMNGDFDPDEYDKQMAAAFGQDYYEVQHCMDFCCQPACMGNYSSNSSRSWQSALLHIQ